LSSINFVENYSFTQSKWSSQTTLV
jgi:hypothetical protein